jgi:hypothetical protein
LKNRSKRLKKVCLVSRNVIILLLVIESKIYGVPEFVPYLLIGAGTASYYAALTIRARNPDAIILIVGDEDEIAYSRTPLSKGNSISIWE